MLLGAPTQKFNILNMSHSCSMRPCDHSRLLTLDRIHQRKKEGGTYSPREAEIIETKCKLDQLIAVADMELKQEKLNR